MQIIQEYWCITGCSRAACSRPCPPLPSLGWRISFPSRSTDLTRDVSGQPWRFPFLPYRKYRDTTEFLFVGAQTLKECRHHLVVKVVWFGALFLIYPARRGKGIFCFPNSGYYLPQCLQLKCKEQAAVPVCYTKFVIFTSFFKPCFIHIKFCMYMYDVCYLVNFLTPYRARQKKISQIQTYVT